MTRRRREGGCSARQFELRTDVHWYLNHRRVRTVTKPELEAGKITSRDTFLASSGSYGCERDAAPAVEHPGHRPAW